MENSKVSIIIPVYNVREYICETLDSVVAQTYGNIECILINDGSTDGSDDICSGYVSRYPDIFRLVNKKNGGPSDARNAGIDVATGKYIFFLDSDDTIQSFAIEKLICTISQTKADMVLTNFVRKGEGKITVMSPEYALETALYQTSGFNHTIYAHLFDARLFKETGLRFRKGIWYEDLEIFPKIMDACRRIAYLDALLYHYRRNRNGSLISSKSPKLADGIDIATEIQNRFVGDDRLYAAAVNRRFAVSFYVFLSVSDPSVRRRCRKIIRSLRWKVLRNGKGRIKDRLGALVSYLFI